MKNVINLLPPSIFNLLAAGEVVDNPSAIVKELVENSIDAKASKITVEVKNGGIGLIKVSDNGIGIADDKLNALRQAFETNDWSSLPEVFGIRNVHERIRMHYGAHYGVSIESAFENGTVVSLLIPTPAAAEQ